MRCTCTATSARACDDRATSPSTPAVRRPALRWVTWRTLSSVFDQDPNIIFCKDRTVAQSCSRVALKILRRSLTTFSSWVRQSTASQSSTSSGPFTSSVSNLSLGSQGSRPRRSKAHLPTSAPFRARPLDRHPAGSPPPAAWSSGIVSRGPVAFRRTGIRFLGILSRRGIAPLLRSAYRTGFGPRRGFHVPRIRDATGVGAPSTPRPAVFPRPADRLRSPLAASPSGQALSPGSSSRLPRLAMTRHHQGFTHVRPSGLPLARLLPRTERGPLGFFPELRTPAGRTCRRTSERGLISNTDQELRIRHRRPPICEFTRNARLRVALTRHRCAAR